MKSPKKILIAIGCLVGLFFLFVLITPLVVDVNDFRPQIVQAVEKNINGKVELGELDLSLFSGPGIRIDGMKISPHGGKPAIDIEQVDLKIPWLRILFAPVVNINVDEPKIFAVENKKGDLNIMTMLGKPTSGGGATRAPPTKAAPPKTNTAPPAQGGGGSAPAPAPSEEDSGLPGIVQNAAVNLNIEDGTIHYKTRKDSIQMNNFQLNIKNLSLSREMDLTSSIDLAIDSKETGTKAVGTLAIQLNMLPKLLNDQFSHLFITGKVDFSALDVVVPPFLQKKAGDALVFTVEARGKASGLKIKHLGLKTVNSLVSLHGDIDTTNPQNPGFNLAFDIDPLQLDEATTWIAGAGKAKGTVIMTSKLRGTLNRPKIKMNMRVEAKNIKPVGAKTLVNELSTNAHLNVVASKKGEKYVPSVFELDVPRLRILMGKNALGGKVSLAGDNESYVLSVKFNSKSFNLDDFTGGPKAAKKTAKKAPPPSKAPPAGGAPPPAAKGRPQATAEEVVPLPERLKEMDKQIAGLKEYDILKKSAGRIQLDFQNLRASGIQFKKLYVDASAERLNFKLNNFILRMFQGEVKGKGNFDIRRKKPVYAGNLKIRNIDLDQAAAVSAPSMSGLVSGKFNANGNIKGRGILWDNLKSDLQGKGNFNIANGKLSTIPIGKWVAEAMDKVAFLKTHSSKVRGGKDYGDRIKVLKAKATISKGVAYLNPTTLEYATGDSGFGGNGTVNFDQDLDFKGDFKIKKKFLPVGELKGKDGRSWVPLKFSGKMNAPKVDYDYTVKKVSTKIAKGRAKKEIKKTGGYGVEKPSGQKGLKQTKGKRRPQQTI